MKHLYTWLRVLLLGSVLLLGGQTWSLAQGTWTQKTNFGGGTRAFAASFVIGNKAYVGTGKATQDILSAEILRQDFWEYDPATDIWTQKASFSGVPRIEAVGFTIGNLGYVGLGFTVSSTFLQDFWAYNPATNQWTQKASFPASGRQGAAAFVLDGKGYVGTGTINNSSPGVYFQDFWAYDPTTDAWTRKADFPGAGRYRAAAFALGRKGYVGTGTVGGSTFQDFWAYDPDTNVWSRKADFGGGGHGGAVSFVLGTEGYIGTGSFSKDMWAYNATSDTWSRKSDLPGNSRTSAVGFAVGNKGYVGTGLGYVTGGYNGYGTYQDVWEYTPMQAQTISFTNPGSKTYGNADFALSATATSGLPVSFQVTSGPATLNGNTLHLTGAGSVTVVASQAGNTAYAAATPVTQTFTVNKATPVIIWVNPADLIYGTPLSATQLNATASVPGTFTYTPALGTVLNVGGGQVLSVRFTPTDAINYSPDTKTVTINVNSLPTVTTTAATAVAATSATLGGNVTEGSTSVDSRGIVYSSTNTTPAIGSGTQVASGRGTGDFAQNVSDLTPGTTYYVRAYASSRIGTSYGSTRSFTTTPNAPGVITPANNSTLATTTPTYSGTAQDGSTVTVYVDGSVLGTTTGTGNWSLAQPTALSQGSHTVYARATVGSSAASANSNTNTFIIDTVVPTVTISSSAGAAGATTSTAPVPFTVTFLESVTGFVAGDVTVTGGALSSFAGAGTMYTFTVTPVANGPITVNVPTNVAQDAAGNGNAAAAPFSITYSQPVTATPVVTAPTNGSLLPTSTPTYSGTAPAGSTVTMYVDEAAVGTTAATTGAFSFPQPTALADGPHTVRATAQLSGYTESAASNTTTFRVDTTAPTVALSSLASNPTSVSPIPVTVTFSESVTGFVAADVLVSNGTLTSLTPASDGASYALSITPAGSGSVTVSLAANVAQDAAGNGNLAAPAFSLTYIEVTTVVALTRSSASPTSASNVRYTLTFAQALSGLTSSNFTLLTSGPRGATISSVTGSGSTYSVLVNTGVGDGTLQLQLASATGLTSTVSNVPFLGEVYTLDRTAPVVSGVNPGGVYNTPRTISFNEGTATLNDVTFTSGTNVSTEGLYALVVTDAAGNVTTVRFTLDTTPPTGTLAINAGAARTNATSVTLNLTSSGATQMRFSNDGTSFSPFEAVASTKAWTLPAGDGSKTVYLQLQDAAGNVSTSITASIILDQTSPTVVLSSTASGPLYSNSPLPVTATFSEEVTGFTATDVVVSNGTLSGFTGSGTSYNFTVTPTANGTLAVNIAAKVAQDLASNGNVAALPFTRTTTLTRLRVLYQNANQQPTNNSIKPYLQLVNEGSTAVPYAELTLRYWLTAENYASIATAVYYAQLGTNSVQLRYVPLAEPRQGAFGYVEYSFQPGAGNLGAGANSGPMQTAFNKQDWTDFDETDDYSYAANRTYTATDRITVYRNGVLVGGVEPAAVAETTSLKVYAQNQNNAATTNSLRLWLQVGSLGTVPVNYEDLTVRYWFSPDGTSPLVSTVDYSPLGNGNVRLNTGQQGTETYLQVGFAPSLGLFYPRSNTGTVQLRINKADWSNFNQANDYSYLPKSNQLAEHPKMTVYLKGQLVYGTEPAGASAASAPTQRRVLASPTGAAPASTLQSYPNPFTDQVQLSFTLPHAEAYTLAVYDLQGRLVEQLPGGTAAAQELRQVAWPAGRYPVGVYLVRLTTASSTQQVRVVKQ